MVMTLQESFDQPSGEDICGGSGTVQGLGTCPCSLEWHEILDY